MEPILQLTNWIKSKHDGQLIKLSGEPYFDHLKEVAIMATSATLLGYEIGLCHDLLEKTETHENEFYETLLSFGYEEADAQYIVSHVVELTDVFTKAAYPDLKKLTRKKQEEARLVSISPGAQTVKYADLIYNIHWVKKYTPDKAKGYLSRKKALLLTMDKGDANLRQTALKCINL